MSNRVQWELRHSVGNDTLDEQHRSLLTRCNALADCLADDSAEGEQTFRTLFDELMAFAREHFDTEQAMLARSGYPTLEDYENEREEFAYLADEIATTENFDKSELQNFLALFWAGHIVGSAKKHRPFLASPTD